MIKKIQNWVHLPYASVLGKIPLKYNNIERIYGAFTCTYVQVLMGLGSVENQKEAIFI